MTTRTIQAAELRAIAAKYKNMPGKVGSGGVQHFDVFLSYSYPEKEVVEGLYFRLKEMGFTAYLDFITDRELNPDKVDKTTASVIRNRLANSSTLLFVVPASNVISKWTPWELGVADGQGRKCGLVGVTSEELGYARFQKAEFLTLYPSVEEIEGSSSMLLAVRDEQEELVLFSSWLRQ
jgi:hypothetical protein